MTLIDIKGLMGVILLSLQDLITFATEIEPRDLNVHIMPDRHSWYILSNYFQQSVPPLCNAAVSVRALRESCLYRYTIGKRTIFF